MSNVSIALVSHDCVSAIGDETDTKAMLSKAFKAARNHWMVLEQDPQLKGALSAVLTKMGESHPDRERLETEIQLLSQFNAWLLACQAGLHAAPPEVPEGHEPIGVMELWHASAARAAGGEGT